MQEEEKILKDEGVRKVLERMRALCSVREYCTQDIAAKISSLSGPDIPSEAGEAVIASLKRDGFLSDSRYAVAFARDKAHLLGWGPAKIRHALRVKGLDEATISEALSLVDDGTSAKQLELLLRKKTLSLASRSARTSSTSSGLSGNSEGETVRIALSKAEIRAKVIRFAVARGYGYDAVNAVIFKILAQ